MYLFIPENNQRLVSLVAVDYQQSVSLPQTPLSEVTELVNRLSENLLDDSMLVYTCGKWKRKFTNCFISISKSVCLTVSAMVLIVVEQLSLKCLQVDKETAV